MLSQKRQQTDEDNKDILRKLQKAIDTISEGINLYPNKAELWAQRANFYIALQTIAPQAKEAALHAGQYAYHGRKLRKGDFRTLWITRIGEAVKKEGISYS